MVFSMPTFKSVNSEVKRALGYVLTGIGRLVEAVNAVVIAVIECVFAGTVPGHMS